MSSLYLESSVFQIHCLQQRFLPANPASAPKTKPNVVVASSANDKENNATPAPTTAAAAPKKKGRRVQHSEEAVAIMEAWYQEHRDHPYPNPVDEEQLGERAGIDPKQVKKWFANQRMRKHDTKQQRHRASAAAAAPKFQFR